MALFGASPASAKPTMSTAGWCRADFTFSVREASFSASRQGVPEARFEGIFSTPLIADDRDRDFRERGHWRAGIKDVRVSRAVFIEPPRDGEVEHLGRSPGGRAPKGTTSMSTTAVSSTSSTASSASTSQSRAGNPMYALLVRR